MAAMASKSFELGVKCVEMEMPTNTEVTAGYVAVEI